jgi:hypothetical protein
VAADTNTHGGRCEEQRLAEHGSQQGAPWREPDGLGAWGRGFWARERPGWWSAEPDVGRVAHGVAARVDRLRATGNGQVPAVVRLAWHALTRRAGGGE